MTIERNFFSPSLYYYYYLFWERGQSKDVCRVDAFSQHLNDSSQSQRSKQHKQPGGPREHQTTRKLAHSAVGWQKHISIRPCSPCMIILALSICQRRLSPLYEPTAATTCSSSVQGPCFSFQQNGPGLINTDMINTRKITETETCKTCTVQRNWS
jgi:hypothetical protein